MKRLLVIFAIVTTVTIAGYLLIDIPDRYDPNRVYQDEHEELLAKFILAQDSSVIELPEGHFLLNKSLSLDGLSGVTVRGSGIDRTVLSFKGQTEGAEGLRIANGKDIILEDLTVEDAAGDNIKVIDTDGITFRRVKVAWTGPIDENNGAYGFYPVLCQKVLIEDCVSMGSSDAGIYVGQSRDVVIRNNQVYQNVAGIESENSEHVKIYNNHCYDNTGGILVFNLPGLTRYGSDVEVYHNRVIANNRKNFGVKGSIVNMIPAGTGVLVLATNDVRVRNNEIADHRTLQVGVISYDLIDAMSDDHAATVPDGSGVRSVESDYRSIAAYNPYPERVTLRNNYYTNTHSLPNLRSDFGQLFFSKMGFNIPDVVYDGIRGETEATGVCLTESPEVLFVNMDAANDFAAWTETPDLTGCDARKR